VAFPELPLRVSNAQRSRILTVFPENTAGIRSKMKLLLGQMLRREREHDGV